MDESRSSPAEPEDLPQRDALIHRELLQVVALMVVAVAMFFVTRTMATSARNTAFRDAEAWFALGERQVEGGQIDAAVDSLRRASVRNRYDRRYALGLARALVRKGDLDAARSALLTLREGAPDDAEINLELARLAARRQDLTEAVRFYHNGLYAPWAPEQADVRRRVRMELIELLLQYGQTARALSELLALSSDLPTDAATHVRVAQLFARAGDPRHALDQFESALRIVPDDPTALAGAGMSAFELGNLASAREYLRRAPADRDDVSRMREVTNLVLTNDPLARRLGGAERQRRLARSLDYLHERLASCPSTPSTNGSEAASIQQEVDALREEVGRSRAVDQDTIETGVDLIDRAEQEIARSCGPRTAWDQALMLIARQHGSETR